MADAPLDDLYRLHILPLSPTERLRLAERIVGDLAAQREAEAAEADSPTRHLIAILDDQAERSEAMRAALAMAAPGLDLVLFDNAPDMIRWLPLHLSELALISLDHDLGPDRKRDGRVFDPATGRIVATVLATLTPSCPVIIHSSNRDAALGMKFCLRDAGWTTEQVVPTPDLDWIGNEWTAKVRELLGDEPPSDES